jgi:hypothetical protein
MCGPRRVGPPNSSAMRGSPLSGIVGFARTESERPVLGRGVGVRAVRREATQCPYATRQRLRATGAVLTG